MGSGTFRTELFEPLVALGDLLVLDLLESLLGEAVLLEVHMSRALGGPFGFLLDLHLPVDYRILQFKAMLRLGLGL